MQIDKQLITLVFQHLFGCYRWSELLSDRIYHRHSPTNRQAKFGQIGTTILTGPIVKLATN